MDDQINSHWIGWYIPLRLASFVIIFAVLVLWMGYPGFLHVQFVLYSVLTLAFALILSLNRKRNLGRVVAVTLALQFLLEISVESGIIYATGNVNSPFSALFILTIVSASLAYRLVGSLLVASLVSLAYAFIIWLGLSNSAAPGLSMDVLRTVFSGQESVFYSIFLHILIFYLVAFISGFLAEKLRHKEGLLAETSQALRKARLETDDILRHVNSGLLTIDSNGLVIYFNRAAERILDCREEDIKGRPYQDVFSRRMPALTECLGQGLRQGMEHPRREIEIETREGTQQPLGVSTSILTDEGRSLRGVIAIFSDLTEAKQMEAKVRAGDRLAAVGELSASIAHEIRNPLASISGSVEVLKKELQVSGENEKLMSLIVKESHRLSLLLTDFLTYARIDCPVYNKVDLCHLINDVIEILYHHDSFNTDIDVKVETPESIMYAVGDENLLKQLLLNLAVNACESFEGGPGRLSFVLASQPDRQFVTLRLEDSGPGIAPKILKKIYEPFFSTKKQGTGLGLAIVHRVCTAMKMRIQASSTVGVGTVFEIEMRRALRPPLPRSPRNRPLRPVRQPK